MFNATSLLIAQFVKDLKASYERMYGGLHAEFGEIIAWAGQMALETIGATDALYHNVEHTILVYVLFVIFFKFC